MKRREFLVTTGAAAASLTVLPRLAFAEAGRIDWYTSSDQNVLDFWTNFVKPPFEAANPGVTLNWDSAAMRFTNSDDANRMLKRTYRDGWAVEGL